jgi:hypothetical protein
MQSDEGGLREIEREFFGMRTEQLVRGAPAKFSEILEWQTKEKEG